MAVNLEIKGMLAKLLATEDIVVEHRKVETACFNVETRVLTLPILEKATNAIYDIFLSHECSHAIFSDIADLSKNHKIPHSYINIVEDVRVEKLIKRKYAGLAKTFYNGYKELHEKDFFQLDGQNVSKLNLADRANLYFKIGNFIDIEFTDKELEIIKLISECETFEEVIVAAEVLYKYCKEEERMNESPQDVQPNSQELSEGNQSSTSPQNESNESEGEESDSEKPKEEAGEEQNKNASDKNTPSQNEEKGPELHTVDALENGFRSLCNPYGVENVYVEVPKVNLKTIIGDNKEAHDDLDLWFQKENSKGFDAFKSADHDLKSFKNSIQREVNYLVKEFECLKAADAHSRSSVSRTGVLDTSRLQSYKFSDDLFKKISIVPDGKNHGLIFVLDWSGSMQNVIMDTCKQLFALIWFCKKVSIPFDVYIFTNEWRRAQYSEELKRYVPADLTPHYEKAVGLLAVSEDFSLVNILTSKVSSRELEHQIANIWRLAYYYNGGSGSYTLPRRYYLSGTPLNEALVTLHEVIPDFQNKYKLQKVHCVILTDGEANALPYHVNVERRNYYDDSKHSFIGLKDLNFDTGFLRDRKLGTTYKLFPIKMGYHEFTDTLIHNLRDKFPTTSFIGIRILFSRDASRFISLYHNGYDNQYKKIQNDWKKLKSFTITNSGYQAYFGINSSSLSQDSTFEVKENATKSQIKNAFEKSLGTKKSNKKILKEFISMIA